MLYIYSGKAGVNEITNMIWSGDISVKNWNYRKLLSFSNSFDYSSEKWDEFYKLQKMIDTSQTPMQTPMQTPTKEVLNSYDIRKYYKFMKTPKLSPKFSCILYYINSNG